MPAAQILKVEAAEGGAALVTARLKERGDLWAAMGKRSNDASYSNPYVVEYRMVQGPRGWQIADALVLGNANS